MIKRTILIIDDEETCEKAKDILQLEDYSVELTHSGHQALERISNASFQLILCGNVLPDMTGPDFLKKLSDSPQSSAVPVILMAADDDIRAFRDAMKNGAVDYVAKPFKGEDLLSITDARIHKQIVLQPAEVKHEDNDIFNGDWKAINGDHELFRNRKARLLKAKTVLFEEGDVTTNVYYLLSGKINIFKSLDCGRSYLIDICLEGDFIGNSNIFSSDLFLESAVALEDAQVIMIPKSDFIVFLNKDKNIFKKFTVELSHKIHQVEKQLIKLAYNSARKRVSEAILFISEKYNRTNALGIPFPFNRGMLASLAGVSNECVSRNLTDFRNEGLIRLNKRGLFILDSEKLRNIRN